MSYVAKLKCFRLQWTCLKLFEKCENREHRVLEKARMNVIFTFIKETFKESFFFQWKLRKIRKYNYGLSTYLNKKKQTIIQLGIRGAKGASLPRLCFAQLTLSFEWSITWHTHTHTHIHTHGHPQLFK